MPDWDYIAECINDMKESIESLRKWNKKDINEFYYHDTIIKISIENINNELKRGEHGIKKSN